MKELISRILRGYREHPIRGLLYAILITYAIAFVMAIISPYVPDSSPGEMTTSEVFYGNLLSIGVVLFAALFSGWFVSQK